MWCFFSNVEEPKAKKKKVGQEKSDKICVWNKKWVMDEDGEARQWLNYDETQNKIFC